MSWFQKTVSLKARRRGCHLITSEVLPHVQEAVARIEIGLCHLFLQHSSASISINENADPDVRKDMETVLNRLVPEGDSYVHDAEGPDDMPAHVKSSLFGVSVTVPITNGRLNFGTWQKALSFPRKVRAHVPKHVESTDQESVAVSRHDSHHDGASCTPPRTCTASPASSASTQEYQRDLEPEADANPIRLLPDAERSQFQGRADRLRDQLSTGPPNLERARRAVQNLLQEATQALPRPGQIIESLRMGGVYEHVGVVIAYPGQPFELAVIQVDPSEADGTALLEGDPNGVHLIPLQHFARQQYRFQGVAPSPGTEQYRQFEDRVLTARQCPGFNYGFVTANCQHFASWVVTGRSESHGVIQGLQAIIIGVTVTAVGWRNRGSWVAFLGIVLAVTVIIWFIERAVYLL
ncbi:hypothetical protein CAOG_03853 [Capsaspora owczarzaki ATCC 30864]|uniref:LRAT domain-containing protein n=1 Tax=Capsaspora owczarzaki (strain ATCC 30864) TaxID=595528 RepID=A0A0D2WNY7_CAPO3|nr:hypothetical protein CAOG_03853 [Capsaspora owczarzaki ATCC 30864]KJE92985.1 hypothetical protein CAOG_003853 [Capsaspora owczarzaki ATCC 30864]|eukprot:XP_004363581.1 hypothetical protein CAOG_03853 [Capsaspora owczarzaki ATCC 30864]